MTGILKNISNKKIIEYGSVLLISLFIFSPILYFYVYSYEISDINFHTEYARMFFESPQEISNNFYISIGSHPAWHWLVIITHEILKLFVEKSWKFSAFSVTICFELITVLLLFWLIRKKLPALLAGALSISMMIVQPIMIFAPLGHHLRLGYIWVNTYANPTSIMLQPLAILQFMFSTEALSGKESKWVKILFAVFISLTAVLTKPGYAICMLPALGFFIMLNILKKKHTDWKMLFLGLILPTIAILIWQYLYVFGSGEESNILFAPFLVMSHYSSNLLIKFFLSIAFPFMVTIMYWKESIKDIRIQFGWMGFGIGVIYTYLFAESGWRLTSGNFLYSGVHSLFILFVCCILFLSEKKLLQISKRARWLIVSTGLLHILFGIYFYFYSLTTISPVNPFK